MFSDRGRDGSRKDMVRQVSSDCLTLGLPPIRIFRLMRVTATKTKMREASANFKRSMLG
jgi:hypothetical protein